MDFEAERRTEMLPRTDAIVAALRELCAKMDRIEASLSAPQRLVVSAEEARAMTGFKSRVGFYQWAASVDLHPCRKGHFLTNQVKLALHRGALRRKKRL